MRMVILLGAAAVWFGVAHAATASPARSEAQASLNALIQQLLREDGSYFTPGERAVIESKCGYRPGEWDGFEANIQNGVFRCSNGRRVDDPEIRAVMRAAEPRIERRVEKVMARFEVRAAIQLVASEAAASAMAQLDPLTARKR